MLVKIGNRDITRNIILETYDVDSLDVTEDWEDGNYVKHSAVVRKRIAGTFKVMCSRSLGLTSKEFIDLVENSKTDGKAYIYVYANNLAEIILIDAFINIKTDRHLQNRDTFVVSVEEC